MLHRACGHAFTRSSSHSELAGWTRSIALATHGSIETGAVKILPQLVSNTAERVRLEREAKTLASIAIDTLNPRRIDGTTRAAMPLSSADGGRDRISAMAS